jgi:hypothetical protein
VNTDPDRSGQARALTVLTPIAPGADGELRAYLEGLRPSSSPLARLPRTHFGRWVIVPDFVSDGERGPDHLATPHLLFTACFDGPLDSYLDELCDELSDEASAGYFVAAYPEATVGQVRGALTRREDLIAFARSAQGMDPARLQAAFLDRLGG